VLGDALCSFNPIYGQGMTASALAAAVLGACLRDRRRAPRSRGLDGFSATFQRRVAQVIDASWGIATREDLRFPGVEGPRSPAVPLLNWYADGVYALSGSDPDITARFYRVQQMLAPPLSLFHPRVAIAVLRRQIRAERP
jgi:2-polyprenyl-6-methoxyphenol hydroxylase-like FAD-dependent oxidoreductase